MYVCTRERIMADSSFVVAGVLQTENVVLIKPIGGQNASTWRVGEMLEVRAAEPHAPVSTWDGVPVAHLALAAAAGFALSLLAMLALWGLQRLRKRATRVGASDANKRADSSVTAPIPRPSNTGNTPAEAGTHEAQASRLQIVTSGAADAGPIVRWPQDLRASLRAGRQAGAEEQRARAQAARAFNVRDLWI